MLSDQMESTSAFRHLPFMGVIRVNVQAMEVGFRMGHPDWINLGQGQPEVGELEGAPPRPKQIQGPVDELLKSGAIVRVKMDLYLAADAIEKLKAGLLAHLEQHGQISPSEWKAITGASRKFTI
ncbi:MAG: hypothetical protein IIA64_09515, partial [Planctomycetes bacterium]|nr:hypothetical protein [Planctomycetota bacterium]